jgi:hemolysin III
MTTDMPTPRVKPKFRGASHHAALYIALGAGAVLTAMAPTGQTALVAAVYAICMAAMYGFSALYHRPTWTPAARQWMRRLDHTGIFLMIAGCYTPISLLALGPDVGGRLLTWVWLACLAGMLQAIFWVQAPRAVAVAIYITIASLGVPYLPGLAAGLGTLGVTLLLVGAVFYIVGALIYAMKRPDPLPAVFGYHEIYHLLVITASVCHFVVILRLLQQAHGG